MQSDSSRIGAAMRSHPAGLAVSELRDMFPDIERGNLDVILKRLRDNGVIYQVVRGFYRPYEEHDA